MRLFDLHCDTLSVCAAQASSIRQHDGAVDLQRGELFSPWCQCFAAFLPEQLTAAQAAVHAKSLFACFQSWLREADVRWARTASHLQEFFDGCNALLTVENAGALGEDAQQCVEMLALSGVCMAGFTWNNANSWADGCMLESNALRPAGEAALRCMEQHGIVPDVSHLGEQAFWQVARTAQGPIVASHSDAWAVCAHPRNLTDDQFCAVRDSGGLVGLNFYAPHLGQGDFFEQFLRHAEHFLSLNGERTLCIGSDLDGMEIPPHWDGMLVHEKLWKFMRGRGYSVTLLEDIFYNNAHDFFCRVLK